MIQTDIIFNLAGRQNNNNRTVNLSHINIICISYERLSYIKNYYNINQIILDNISINIQLFFNLVCLFRPYLHKEETMKGVKGTGLRKFMFFFSILALNILPMKISSLLAAELNPKCLPTSNPCTNSNPGCIREHWELPVWDPINNTWTKYTGDSHQILLTTGHKKCQGKYDTDKRCTNLAKYCKQHNYYQDQNCEILMVSNLFDINGVGCQED